SFYSYWKILVVVYKSKKVVRQNAISKNDIKIYKSLLIIFGTYLLTKLPEIAGLTYIIHLINWPECVLKTCFIFIAIDAALNPLILAFVNPEFAPHFRQVFICFQKAKVHPNAFISKIQNIRMNESTAAAATAVSCAKSSEAN